MTEQRSAVETAKTEAAQADKAALLEEIYNSTLRAHKHNQECLSAEQSAQQATAAAQAKLQELHKKLSEQLQQLDGQSLKDTANLDKALELLNQRILQLHSEAAKLSGVTSELERLAAALVDNEPCPVCGALQHPHPATITAAQKSELQLKNTDDYQTGPELTAAAAKLSAGSAASGRLRSYSESKPGGFCKCCQRIQRSARTF